MSIQRDTIPFGPAKIMLGAVTFYSAKAVDEYGRHAIFQYG